MVVRATSEDHGAGRRRRGVIAGVALLGAVDAAVAWSVALGAPTPCRALGGDCATAAPVPSMTWLQQPVAARGVLAYVSVAVLCALRPSPRRSGLIASLGAAMALGSCWLAAWMFGAGAFCALCAFSAACSLAIGGTAMVALPVGLRWRSLLRGAVAVVALLSCDAGARRLLAPEPAANGIAVSALEQPLRRALAEHLAVKGVRLYGAFWCPECAEQKAMFGSAADALPYVECGFGSPRADVELLPSWEFGGVVLPGMLSIAELERRSGFIATR